MKVLSKLLVILSCGMVTFNAVADEVKIGVVDLQKVMQTTPQMKSIQQKLEADFKPRRDKLVAMEENIKKDTEKFKRDNAIMSPEQKKELEKRIIANQQSFERQGQQYQQELSTAHNEAMEELYTKIRKAVADVAQAGKFDLIITKEAAPFNADKLDVTAEVLKKAAA